MDIMLGKTDCSFHQGKLESTYLETKKRKRGEFFSYRSFVVSSLGKAIIVSVATNSAASIAIFIASFSLGALKIRTVS
jgi:hypothetical protein